MQRKKIGSMACIILLCSLLVSTSSFSYQNFELTDSNQGAQSHYIFSFTPVLSYSDIQLVITFPIQYSLSSFASMLQCFSSYTGKNDNYTKNNCWVQPDSTANLLYLLGSVVVDLPFVSSTSKNYILLKNVVNPQSNLTSYFQLCLRKNGVKIDCSKYYSRATFSPISVQSALGIDITPYPEPTYIGRGTSYIFDFKITAASLNYINQNLRIRVKLPEGFSSDGPLCSIGNYDSIGFKNQYIPLTTSILPHTLNEVDCGPLSTLKDMLGPNNQLNLKVDNMLNSMDFMNYTDFKIQIIRQIYMQPIETIVFPGANIEILPQNLQVEIKQSNYMRDSTNVYYFMLNHYTNLNENSSITVEFLSDVWNLHGCFGVVGFTSPQTMNCEIVGNKIILNNYGSASEKVQQIFGVNLTSYTQAGIYPVKLTTQLDNQNIGSWTGSVTLNETIGTFNLISISAVQAATKLPVDSTGPLQMTFFLNYELPPSDDVPNGTLQITIFPQIPEPDPEINGVVKCYWKGTLQAADCTYDNSQPNKTIITLVSPPHDAFKYSQIPVIITTQGGTNTSNLGLTIDPLVQRYRFECQFHLYNSTTIPSEVFYTTWIADAIQMTTCSVIATSHECQQFTHIQLNFTTPLLDSSLQKQFRIMVQFLNADGSAWANSVGYEINKIYQRYPCVVVGLVGDNINCDLYTYYQAVTPYSNMHINNNISGPYILIYGFNQNVPTGVPVRIQIPKIKLGSVVGAKALVGLSILEETPGQKQPYVELYYQDVQAFTILPPISIPLTSVPNSQPTPIQIQTYNQYHVQWSPILPSTVRYITYQLTPEFLPSLTNKDAVCTTGVCVGHGLPANWIKETVAAAGSPFHTMDTLLNYVRSMNYLPQTQTNLPIRMFTYDGNGKTIDKYQMNIHYSAKIIPTSSFDFVQTSIYSGLEQWYSISFANTNSTMTDYPFMRFILRDGLSFSNPAQCNSSSVLPYNQSGIICIRQNAQTMRVHNIKGLAPLGTYNMWFRMQTTQQSHSSTISPTVQIHLNHNNSVDSSIVSFKQNLMLTQAPVLPLLKAPQRFQIHNPQIVNEDVRIGYIGPLYLQFSSQVSGVYDISVEFSNHLYNGGYWRTPTSNNLDPVVCFLNEIRYDCTPTNAPLKIDMLQTSVIAGVNQIRFDTQYIDPFNGIKFPDVPGMYLIKLNVNNATSSSAVTIYAQIQPPKFLHMQAGSIVKDINTESVYKVNFTLPTWHVYPSSYFDTANHSRITVQFPTLINDQPVFPLNLGLYEGKFQQRVGCYFKTGGNFVTFSPTYTLQCRLIPSKKLGEPVKVQIINHAAFSAAQNSLSVYIFKVLNPALPHSSVPITVRIDHVQVGTGYIFPLFKQTYRVFLDPRSQNLSPTTYPSADPSSTQFFDPAKDVGDYGPIFMNAHTVSGSIIKQPYHMIVKLPKYFIPEDSQIASAFSLCPTSAFEECVSVPEINYLMVKSSYNISQFQPIIKNYPISISLQDSFFYSNIIEAGRWTGIVQYNISASVRWQQIQGLIIFNYCQAAGMQQKIVKNKDHFQILISFTTSNFIPELGSIEIGFPASVTNVQPHCRSAAELGSGLLARSGASGQIGCMVQNVNKWVITGFNNVLPGTTIIISGMVDLPATSGSIGLGEIITYADTNLVDIHSNGSRIDYINTDFNLVIIDSFAMNPIQDVFMTQRDVIRAGFVGQFRILLQSALPITQTDTVTLRMGMKDIRGTNGGFSQSSRPKVCQFIRIDTNEQIGCKVTSQSTDISILNQQSIQYIVQPTQNLIASVTYEIRLTSQSYVEPAMLEGIPYPTSPGTYKIETITTISGVSKIEHRYIQVYGPAFTQLQVTQYNYLAGEYNLIWIQFVPTVPITTDHQIIVQFPTLSSNGTTMFDDNLGLNGYKDGQQVPVDIFDSPPLNNDYMKCRIYFGDKTRGVPVRVVCGFLTSNLLTPNYLRFAFGFVNPPRITVPSIPSQISLPILVYSYDPYYLEKTNFNLVNAAVLVYNGQTILAPNGYFATSSNQLQFPNDNLVFADAHTFPLLIGDAYVMRFKFPLRINDKFPGFCKKSSGVTAVGTYGDAYYHQRLGIIVCKVTSMTVPAVIAPLSAAMMFSGFYTPWYRLADSQRIVNAIATYRTTSTSQVINYFDLFPHLVPRYQFDTLSTLTLEGHIKHYTACQSDDYIFRVRLEAAGSANLDLQYCKMISINLPLTTIIDYYTLNTDCVEHPDSQIQVTRCNIDLSARAIFVQIVPGIYTNGLMIAVKTKDHAIRNPCVFWNAFDIKQFTVFFYSWENITYADSRSPDYAYMVMDLRNLNAFALPHVQQEYPAGMFSYYYTFDWIHTPHERYYRQFPQYTVDQYSPFSFDIWLTAALSTPATGTYHQIKLTYGNNYVARTSQWTLDLNYDKTVCYLDNNRVQRCYLDIANMFIYMLVDFAIPAAKPIHVYFSILDPKQPQYNGFRYIGSSDIDKVMVQLTSSSGAIQVFQTQPYLAKQTQVGGTGGPLPERGIRFATIDWATNMQSQLNVFDMTFYVNRSDITALQFLIPLRNQINELIYSGNSRSAFFNINDGGQYPCGNNHPGVSGTGNPKCFIYNGDNTQMGFPTIITMQDIQYSGSIIKARLIFSNPDVTMKWFTIKVRAFSGTPDTQSVFGHQYVGYWIFPNFFRTVPGTYTSFGVTNQLGSAWLYPNKGNWRQQTTWTLQGATVGGNSMAALGLGLGGYAIVQVLLNNYVSGYVDDQFCQVDFSIGNSNSDDMLILKSKQSSYTKAFFIKKWTANPWSIQYFKCKHYGNGLVSYMYPSQIILQKDLHNYNVLNSFYPYAASMASIEYFQVAEGRVLLQFNLASMLNTLFAEGFIWDDQVNYQLNIDLVFYSYVTWSSASACYVTGGFESTIGQATNCYLRSTYAFTVRGFQKILNRVNGKYIIKIQLDTNDLSNPPNSLGANIVLYANSDTNLARQYIYSTSTSNTYSRSMSMLTTLSGTSYCGIYYAYTTSTYNTYNSNNMIVELLEFGVSSTSVLNLKFRLRPTSAFQIIRPGFNSYPWFRFYVEGYDFSCINPPASMRLTYYDAGGNPSIVNAGGWGGTRCSGNFFQVQFYASQSISSIWSGATSFAAPQYIQIDTTLNIVAAEMPYLRDWITIRSYINSWNYDYCCSDCCACCAWCLSCGCSIYYCYTDLVGVSHVTRNYVKLAFSMNLDALTYNTNYPTQLIFTMTQIFPQIGKSIDKLLLLQFNTGSHPFNYINATGNNHEIECRCITSWASTFNPSTTVLPKCVLRLPQLTFVNFAITVDIDVAPDQNLQCYFPGWQVPAGFSYQVTAKLINEGTNYPPWIGNAANYGGYYWVTSNFLPFSAMAAPGPITMSQSPTIYSTPRVVNLFWTSAYQLQLTIPSTISNPVVYIDFQKSGFIPDQSFCSSASVFAYCRVYSTYRNIIVARFITAVATSTVTFTKGSTNLQYPKHKQPGTNYDILAYMRSGSTNQYTFAGQLARNSADLLTTTVQFYAKPEKTTSTNLQTYRTDLLISFNLGGHTLFSTPLQGAKIVITDDSGLLTAQRGCTASSVDNPMFVLDCGIVGSQVVVTNPSYTQVLSVSGLIQVVIGVTNPASSVVFTLKSYQYWISSSNYGQQIETTTIYQINAMTGTQQKRSQMRMQPFTTKVYSTVHTPFRIAFKISNSPPTLPDQIHYDLSYKMILSGFDQLASFTNFECLFKQFTLEPTYKIYTPLPNSYRNWKQYTQYVPLYAYCNKIGANLQIQAPRTKPLSINNYYELVIMPTGTTLTQTGFNNAYDQQYRLITYPDSCEFIGQYMPYEGPKIKLLSMYLVTYRPLVATALQLHFQLLFSSSVLYPNHYFQIHFQDINYNAIRPPYNQVGMKVPCTLSSQFVTAGRTNGPHCIVNYVHEPHQDLILRVVQIGSLPISNSYKISLDDFLLPDLTALLEPSNPFSVCLRYHNQPSNIHYERCFQQIFVIDGQLNINPVTSNTGNFYLPSQNRYAATVAGNLEFTYPMNSVSAIDQKSMARINGGYSATSPSPLSFGSHTMLWYNPMINLYILKQPALTAGTVTNITMNGLINPEPYQKEEYQFINTVQVTYYDDYHPNNIFNYNQPPYSHFVLYPSNVMLINSYQTDIRNTIPTDGQSIVKLRISILDTVADLTRKLNDLFEIVFDPASVSQVEECWVQSINTPIPYRKDGWCQTTTNNRVLLYNFYQSNVNANLILYVRLRHISNTVGMVSKLYSDNGQIQYNDTYSHTITKINLGATNHALLSFTQNHYTVYYFQQAITPLTISSVCKYMYFSLNLPKLLQYGISIFTITLPATIIPSNLVEPLQRCEWLLVDRYNRQFHTGVYSACSYLAGKITITAPYGGLLAFSSGTTQYTYLLKVRELDVINTRYFMPTASKPEQLLLSLNDTNIFKYDSLIIHPYEHFSSLAPYFYTLNINQLNTYHIQFIPAISIAPGYEAVLELSIDTRYLVKDLGMTQLYATYGVNYNNQTRIDNLNYNIKYDILNNKWINGAPYSCYSSTASLANQTTVHTGTGLSNKRTRITHLIQKSYVAGTKYIWKIPLLANPSTINLPFRMNLTLWTYQAPTVGVGIGQKELFYQIINHKFTKPNNPTPIGYTIPNPNPIQITTGNISVKINNLADVPLNGEYLELKLNNQLTGIIGLNNLELYTEGDPSYTFYFFPRVNMVMAHKKLQDFSKTVDLGALKITNQYADYYGYDWLKIHTPVSENTIRKAGPVTNLLTNCVINPITSFTVTEGLGNIKDSQFLLTITFINSNCWIPRNSTMIINYNSAILQEIIHAPCYISFRQYTCIHSAGQIELTFYEMLPIGRTITINTYLRSKAMPPGSTTITGYIYGIPGSSFTRVIDFPAIGTHSIATDNLIDSPMFEYILTNYIYEDSQMDIRGTLVPNNVLNTIDITHPFTSSLASKTRMIMRQNSTSPYRFDYRTQLKWFQNIQKVISNVEQIETIPPNGLLTYNLIPAQQYTFIMQATYDVSGLLNNFTVGKVGFFYQFQYLTQNQIAYEEVYPIPIAEHLTIINPFTQISQQTAVGFQFSVTNYTVVPGNRITIQLDTYNLRYEMFRKSSQFSIECVERVKGILTWQPILVCEVTQQPTIANPNQALIVTVYPKLPVPAGTIIQIWLSPIFNPPTVMVSGATVRVDKDCNGQKRCVIYQARGYYRTTSGLNFITGLTGTFTPSSTEVLLTNIQHCFKILPDTYSATFFRYPQNYKGVMPLSCVESGGNTCLIFPNQKRVLTILPNISTDTITLQGMTNGIYIQPNEVFFDVLALTPTQASFYQIPHNNLTTRRQIPATGTPTWMTITPTQTPGIFLRNYMNTATIQMYGLYSTTLVNAFYINAPKQIVTWDTKYCNATFQSLNHDPYPTRLLCSFINDTTMQILIQQGVQEIYMPNITQQFIMTVHAKFFIEDFAPGDGILYVTQPVLSGTFNSYGSYSVQNHSYAYYITQASTPITISEHRVPIIGKADFNTESYMERIPNVNQKTTFQLLIDPKTTEPVSRIQFVIPEEFGYPPVGVHDACSLITTDTTQIANCYEIRRNNKTIISLELVDAYDNGPRILKIGSLNQSSWFTAPNMPGSWYNFTVLMYSDNGTLLQAQTTQNCSQIGGLDLSMPQIVVTNGLDQNMNQIIDVSFVVGNLSIRQGYPNLLSNNPFYTEIRIIFQNLQAFPRDLGLDRKQGELTGCVTKNIQYNRQVSCALNIGMNINDEPYITITGYEPIMPGTNVTISLANIKMLPRTERSTVSVAVVLKKINDTKSAFLYNPTKKIIMQTSLLNTAPPSSLSVVYNSPRIVNSPTILNFTITPTIEVNSYFVLKFPFDGLNDQYKLFSPLCPLASKIDNFYRSDVVRIYPSTPHPAGVPRSYVISGFPTPVYSMSSTTWNITVQAYRNLKQVNSQIYTISNFQIATCKLNFGLLSTTSPYTHETQVVYVFEFVINSSTSASQNSLTVGIKFPTIYGDVRETNMTCQMNSNASCQFTRPNYLQITGTRQSGILTHRLTLRHVNNPSSLINIFQISSYIGQDIEHPICSGQTQLTLLKSPIQSCTLDATSEHSTKQIDTVYHFGFTCPDIIRNNSIAYIAIPAQFAMNNLQNLNCWADQRENLLTDTCTIQYINGTFYIEVNNIVINKNQKIIGINVEMNNPVTAGPYTFTANLTVLNFTYGKTTVDNLTIYDGVPKNIQSLELVNLPKQSGVESYYFLRVPTSSINSSLDFSFPPEFQLPSEVQIQKFTSNSSTWASSLKYSDMLGLEGLNLNSQVSTTNSLSQKITIQGTNTSTNTSGQWTYFMIKPIRNPSYQSQTTFSVDSYYNFGTNQRLLIGTAQLSLNYTLSPPSDNILHTAITVSDNDVLEFTDYRLTYRLSTPHQTNATIIYIRPPIPEINYALLSLNCCLVVNSSSVSPYTYCNNCTIIKDTFKFVIAQNGIKIPADTDFQIRLINIYNPPNATDCSVFPHHELSYFGIKILKNDLAVTHNSLPPTNMNSPCQKYRVLRADILPFFPNVLYAGMVHPFKIRLSQPTKMLRVTLNCSDALVSFEPNILYFPNYDTIQISGLIVVSSVANNNNNAYINITHQQSGTFDFFRPNLPYPIKIVAYHKQYVIVKEKQAQSIGYDITVPITITVPSSVDMFLQIKAVPIDSKLIFNTTTILLPAFSNESSFSFRYDGDKIPQTFNLSLTLKSSYPLNHELQPQMVYLYFSRSPIHNTLPPVMSVEVMYNYKNNSQFIGSTVYHYNNTGFLFYDKLLPNITKHADEFVGSTSADIIVHTRQQATVAYLIYQYGDHLKYKPATPQQIRSHPNAKHIDTKKNSTLIVNPYAFLNLTMLDQQTQYFIYMMAYSTLGDSLNITTHIFTTKVLSNAASFKLITKNDFLTDQVEIVRALADILKIDPYRIKVVSSEKLVSQTYYNQKYQNQPYYQQRIVVSPSATDDDIPAQQIILDRLMNSEFGKSRLQQLIPNWIGRFNLTDLKIQNRVKPVLRQVPVAKRISYYNATFQVRYWEKARIYAILIQFFNQTLQTLNYTQTKVKGVVINSENDQIRVKQIVHGLDSNNFRAHRNFTAVCNKQGYASIFFDQLMPGSRYEIYVTATNPQIYEPVIYSDTISKTQFYTLWNPNLRNKQKLVLSQLKKLKPEMYEAIQQFYDNQEIKISRANSIRK